MNRETAVRTRFPSTPSLGGGHEEVSSVTTAVAVVSVVEVVVVLEVS